MSESGRRRVLAFDTSTPLVIAGIDDGKDSAWARRGSNEKRPQHTALLLPLIEELVGGDWASVTRIGVGVGPGSFTGVRISVATGRALAMATGIPLAAVSVLDALAAFAADESGREHVVAAVDARRGEVFALSWSEGRRLGEIQALGPDALAELVLRRGGFVVGDGALRYERELAKHGISIEHDPELHVPNPLYLCKQARLRGVVPPHSLLPDYIRLPDVDMNKAKR